MKSTIKSISQLAGVSASTVSNVLNGKKSASKETTDRIVSIAKELGYLGASSGAVSIETVYFVFYKKHGLVLTDTPFFTSLMEGIERGCRTNNCKMQVYNINVSEGDVRPKTEQLLSEKNAGIIVMATEMSAEDARLFKEAQIPLVMLDGWLEDFNFDSVLINNSDAAYKAVRYLAELGHRKIGYLKSSVLINNFYYRSTGFKRALEKSNLGQVCEDYIVELPPAMDGAYRGMTDYLKSKPQLPTAFFADNDNIAIGAIKAMAEQGIRMPEQVSVIGMDDMPFCEVSTPRLTTMRVFKEAMGELAVTKLMDIARSHYPVPIKTQVGTELIVRESVADLR